MCSPSILVATLTVMVVVDPYGADKWVYPENCAAVIIPDVFRLSWVPIPADPPINLPLESSYFKNLPSTFALSSSTSSSFKRLTSPDPGPCARTRFRIFLSFRISDWTSTSEFSTSSLTVVSSINLIAFVIESSSLISSTAGFFGFFLLPISFLSSS